jgi:pimeloyl-ACP methyl ester carboxylesterase
MTAADNKKATMTNKQPLKKSLTLFTILLVIVLLAGMVGCTSTDSQAATQQPAANESATPGIAMEDCQLSPPGSPLRMPARCGKLAVYEDRAEGSGRQIELNIALIPAVSRNPAPDPLFFLAGGPGQAATETFPQLSFAFNRINQKRDIVLVDQRGTGRSHPLTCPQTEEMKKNDAPDFTPLLKACLASLDANPALYTTSIAMDDLDQVRDAMGYEKINLYGVSYGTRAALTYLQQHPSHVRSLILDGVVPQQAALGLNVARDAQRALDLAFERCAAQTDCAQAFPDPSADFNSLLSQLQNDPVDVSLPDPTSGQMTEVNFTPEKLGSAVRLLSYAPETAALLPLLVHTAQVRQNFGLLAAQYLVVAGQLTSSINDLMGYSVLCAEDVPFINAQQAKQANAGTYLGDQQTDELFKICQVWPRGAIPAGFKNPVRSDVPVLLLSGEADPVTPPSNAQEVAQTLPNSLLLVASGQGHNVIYRGCLPVVAADFIEKGSLQNLDTTCVQEIQATPFFVNFNGPSE